MKRKWLTLLLCAASSLCLALGLCACGEGSNNTGENADGNTGSSETLKETEGLEYELAQDGTSYICTGMGTATKTDIVIASEYKGLSVTGIGRSAFAPSDDDEEEGSALTSVVIPDSVTSIGDYAFYCCDKLSGITIPSGVTEIGKYAFEDCSSLTSIIIIPNAVKSIGNNAFSGCSDLASITLPDSVTSIGNWAFSNTAYYENDGNWVNNVLYIGKHLIKAETSLSGSYEIKAGTLTIAGSAFNHCSELTGITIPDSMKMIGDSAFYGCSKLTGVVIPGSVTEIKAQAFDDCGELTSIVIPNGVTYIGDSTFHDCKKFTSITIPSTVTRIGSYAFSDCFLLASIVFQGTTEQWNAISKGNLWNVPAGTFSVHCTDGNI